MKTNTDFRNTAEYQNAIDNFMRKHFLRCVSELISAIGQDMDSERVAGLSGKLDYKSAAYEHIMDNGDRLDQEGEGAKERAQDFCEENNIEPQYIEVFEHWQVSEWLADRLEERGEIVDKDFYGLCVWGRTCTGQAIILDSVIQDIYEATL